MRVLLIQMPFFTLDSPSISLSLIKAALDEDGVECELRYLNLDFGERLGAELYSFIAGSTPVHLLFGDLIFAPSMHAGVEAISQDTLRTLVTPPGTPGRMEVPEALLEAYPDLARIAGEFIDDVASRVEWERYDLVGFGTMFTIAPVLALSRRIKERPAAPRVILGGSYCEDVMGEALANCFPWIDYVCRGEGERLIVELARHLGRDEGVTPEHIAGLVWRGGDGSVICNGEASALYPGKATLVALGAKQRTSEGHEYELDRLPRPRYDDWIEQFATRGLMPPERRRLPIQTSRGCWYGEKHHCTFCGLNDATIAYRRKSPERAVSEFRELFGYGVKMVHAVDDIMDFRHLKTMLPELARAGNGGEIFYEIKANLSLEDVQLLHDSGVVWIQPGIESLSTRMLELMDKGTTAIQNVRLLRYAAEVGISVAWNVLYGFPGEDPRELDAMAELIPALTHFQPPYIRCTQVRLHRFSPLFEDRDRVGLQDVVPTPAHHALYPFTPDVVERLAYYFDHGYVSHPDPSSYVGRLASAVLAWHDEVGEAVFLSLSRGDTLRLLDTRRAATVPRASLEGFDRALFLACAHGATLKALSKELDRPATEIERALAPFIERRWVIALDGKYLSLAVPMDRYARAALHVPAPILERNLREAYRARLSRVHQGGGRVPSAEAYARLRSGAREG